MSEHEKAFEKVQLELAKLPQEVQDAFFKRSLRHRYSAHLDAQHAVRNIFGSGTTTCSQTDLFILSGRENTNGSGRLTIPIEFCGIAPVDQPFVIIGEPNFVATAHGTTPSFLTIIVRYTPRQLPSNEIFVDRSGSELSFLDDVMVDVMSWRGDGTPAANIAFSWVCTVEAARKTIIGG